MNAVVAAAGPRSGSTSSAVDPVAETCVGIVAVQGGVAPHEAALDALGIRHRRVLRPEALDAATAVILPGGESTAMTRVMATDGQAMACAVRRIAEGGRPVLATCAGLILAARWGLLDVTLERNGWGSQIASFEAIADDDETPLVCIRAPRIVEVRAPTEVLLTFRGEPMRVRRGSVVGATDHPELTTDRRLHRDIFGTPRAKLIR